MGHLSLAVVTLVTSLFIATATYPTTTQFHPQDLQNQTTDMENTGSQNNFTYARTLAFSRILVDNSNNDPHVWYNYIGVCNKTRPVQQC